MGLIDKIIVPIDKLSLSAIEKEILQDEGIKFCNLYTFDLHSNNNIWYILNNQLHSITGHIVEINNNYPVICSFQGGQQSCYFGDTDYSIIEGLFEITTSGIIKSKYEL